MNSGRAWTAEELERLHALLAERRLDYAGIAKAMGRSKDAIIGKVHRLKLPSPPSFYNPAVRGPRGRWLPAADKSLSPVQRPSLTRRAIPPPVRAYEPPVAVIPPVHTCQWIDGERPWRFCGAPVAPGRPYCRPHVARAYTTRSALREVA